MTRPFRVDKLLESFQKLRDLLDDLVSSYFHFFTSITLARTIAVVFKSILARMCLMVFKELVARITSE